MAIIKFKLNDQDIVLDENPSMRLLDVLREQFGFVGVKEGCGEGECGACAVLINNEVINSCLVPLGNVMGKEIMTIEGYAQTKRYEVLKDAYAEEGAVQCGFCTPGFVLATHKYIEEIGEINDIKIKEALSGNFCRCTGYTKIIDGVKEAIHRHNDKGDK